MDIHEELYEDLEKASPERLSFTRKAFRLLPRLERPRILDAGCGRGDVTIELARLGGGEVFGIDRDDRALEIFRERIRDEGLDKRVHAIHGSFLDMDFDPESFDIVWAEGSLHIVGLEAGLLALRRFIRPGGFLVVHEMVWIRPDPPTQVIERWGGRFPGIPGIDEFIEMAAKHKLSIEDRLAFTDDFWGRNYYDPLERRIALLREKYSDNRKALAILDREQSEVDRYRACARWVGSCFFILKCGDRRDGQPEIQD